MVTGLPVVLLIVVVAIVVHPTRAIDFGYHPSAEEFDSLVRQSWGRDLLQRRVQDRRFVPRYQHQTSIRFEPPELDFQLFDKDQDQDYAPSQPFVFESVEDNQQGATTTDQFHVQSELLEIKEPHPTHKPQTQKPQSAGNGTTFPIYFTHPTTGIVYAISQVGAGVGQNPSVVPTQSRNDSNSIAIYVTKAQYDADMESLRRQYEQQCQPIPPGTVISTLNPVHHGGTTARPQIIRLKKPKNPMAKPSNKLPNPNYRPPPVMVTSGPIDHVSDQLLKLPHRTGSTTTTSTTTSTTSRPNTRRKKRKKKPKNKTKVIKRRPGYGGNNTRSPPGSLPIILGKRPSTTKIQTSTSSTTTTRPPPAYTQVEKPHMPLATLPTSSVFSQHLLRGGLESAEESETLEEQEPLRVAEPLNLRTRRWVEDMPGVEPVQSKRNSSLKALIKKRVLKSAVKRIRRSKEAKGDPLKNQQEMDAAGTLHLRSRRSLDSSKSAGTEKSLKVGRSIKVPTKEAGKDVTTEATKGSPKGVAKESRTILSRVSPHGVAARRVSTPKRRSPKGSSRRRKTKQQTPPTTKKQEKNTGGVLHIPTALHLLHRNHSQDEAPKVRNNANQKQRNTTKIKIKERKRGRPELPSFDIFELMSDGDYEDEGEEEEEEEDDDEDYYFEEEHKDKDTEKPNKSSSTETTQSDLKEDSSSAEEGADFGAMVEEETTTTATITSSEEEDATSSTKDTMAKKKIRIKRRPVDSDEDYDDDEDSGIAGFFRMIFYPVQVAMTRLMDGFGTPDEEEDKQPAASKYPSYTLYHSAHSNEAYAEPEDEDAEDDEDSSSSLGSWFGSWFGLQRRTKKIGSTTTTTVPVPLPAPTKAPPGWLESWFGFGSTTETETEAEDDYDKWFSTWFDSRPKRKVRRRSTTSTSTTSTTTTTHTPSAAAAQVPILTIVDPLRNPQNWIGILAHHIVNTTGSAISTSTSNPLLQALATRMTTRATTSTTTTTSRPEVPRRISYDKYQIWRLKPQDEEQVRALESFKKGEDGVKLHWLKGPSLRGLTDVLVPPKMLVDFQGTLNYEGIAHEVLIFDVGKAIAYELTKEDYLQTTRPSKPRPTVPPPMTWNRYHNHDEIVKYLETVRMRHPQLVELIHIGRSFEGRPLIVVKIESKQSTAAASNEAPHTIKRPKRKRKSGQANAVFVEAGAQGLAWIGPATATWMIAELLRLMKTNKSNEDVEFIRNTTWYIMPVLNPDGYAYSHEYDRFWKKSRSQHQAPPPSGLLDSAMTWLQQKRGPDKVCYGVDLDRNWLYHWGKRGSSKAPCNEFYAGPAPFSEPETKAVSEFLMDYRTQIKLYISLQAYGQVISYPVKANSTFNSERLDDFLDVAMVGTDGLRKKGSKSRYKVDASNDLIEQRSGCADAFAAYEIGIPFSYTLQLADNGVHGYLLPSSAIEPTARDAFEIISGMLDYI
ncbi:uncharacterized protein LOC6525618 [Drosophila yakuba]|uniref:Uncharacterized protein, isoform A n=1 Tax=Drosophila yakuba TaxID=7245 RepID=B4Q253_DROYA|nr:uncharacterized protein LOC6525618 [Drosophila yakuba]EDX02561.1 uncharacterized protein Dyak_GE15623, isoform A [Drosophila yakuba]